MALKPKVRTGARRLLAAVFLATLLLHPSVFLPAYAAGGGGIPVRTLASSSQATTNATGLVTIGASLFEDTVPPSATVGENYTVRVEIQSNSNISLPIIVRIVAPVSAIFVHPLLLRASLPAMSTITANFSLVPFVVWHQAPINVTASVWVWFIGKMATPELAASTSTYIYSISPSSFPYLAILLLLSAAVVVVIVIVFHPGILRRGRGAGG